MQTEAKIDVVRRLCIDAILYHQDATTLLNAVYAKIQIPLIAFDETIALIAYAFPRPFYFEDWEEIVEYGTCPKKKVLQNLRDYQEVIYRNRADGDLVGHLRRAAPDLLPDHLPRFPLRLYRHGTAGRQRHGGDVCDRGDAGQDARADSQ